jgi:hypothetical protein
LVFYACDLLPVLSEYTCKYPISVRISFEGN